MEQKLKFAAFTGIIYLISIFHEVILGLILKNQPQNSIIATLLFITYVICILSTIIFFYGFIIIGKKLENNLLINSSWIIILTSILYYIYAMYTINYYELEPDIIGISALLLFGFSGIAFGIGLIRISSLFGNLAAIAGILEIVTGILFITIILIIPGLIILIPAIILEILILLKASESNLSWRNSIDIGL